MSWPSSPTPRTTSAPPSWPGGWGGAIRRCTQPVRGWGVTGRIRRQAAAGRRDSDRVRSPQRRARPDLHPIPEDCEVPPASRRVPRIRSPADESGGEAGPHPDTERFGECHSVALPRFQVVVLERPDGRTLTELRWGFRPAWLKSPKGPPPINARAETLLERPMFRGSRP